MGPRNETLPKQGYIRESPLPLQLLTAISYGIVLPQ